jgi:REP element-mobilizing transposase RayT
MSAGSNDPPNRFRNQRKSIRLKSFEYDSPGAYFVTIETFGQRHLFGRIVTDTVILTPVGSIAQECWKNIPEHFPCIQLDEYAIMPNHLHGILWINESFLAEKESMKSRDLVRGVQGTQSTGVQGTERTGFERGHSTRVQGSPSTGVQLNARTDDLERGRQRFSSISPKRGTLGVVVRTFKAAVTTESWRKGYERQVWKRNYYDRIIRSEEELNRIREYIINNPAQWAVDKNIIPIEKYLFP